jgi:hypothetical protein
MIAGEGTELIRRPAKDIYEFVLDLEQYRRADLKIGTVHSVTWREDHAEISYSGRFRGIPTPAVRQTVTVEPYHRIDVRSIPGTLAHFASEFHGLFTFEEIGDGTTRVFHREELVFRAPLGWIVEPLLRDWLANDTPEEVRRMKVLLESEARSPIDAVARRSG